MPVIKPVLDGRIAGVDAGRVVPEEIFEAVNGELREAGICIDVSHAFPASLYVGKRNNEATGIAYKLIR